MAIVSTIVRLVMPNLNGTVRVLLNVSTMGRKYFTDRANEIKGYSPFLKRNISKYVKCIKGM